MHKFSSQCVCLFPLNCVATERILIKLGKSVDYTLDIAEQRVETGLLINSYVPIPMSFHLGFTK